MTVTNGLITSAQLKRSLGIQDDNDNEILDDAINTASRAVEDWCGRQFYDTGSATARRYRPSRECWADVDDFSTVTGLIIKTDVDNDGTFETTWASTDYELDPPSGVFDGITGWPFSRIYNVAGSSRYFRWPNYFSRRYTLEVTARWGWAAVPEPVRQATLQVAAEEYRRKDAPFGIAQTVEFGPISLASDTMKAVAGKLGRYRNMSNVAGVA